MVSKLYIRFKSFRIMKTLKKRKKKFNNCQGKNNSSSWLDQFSNLGNTDKSQICILIDAFLLQKNILRFMNCIDNAFLHINFKIKPIHNAVCLQKFFFSLLSAAKLKVNWLLVFSIYTRGMLENMLFHRGL